VPDEFGGPCSRIALDSRTVIGIALVRDDDIEILSDNLIPPVTKDLFCCLVEEEDPVIFIDGYEGFIGVFDSALQDGQFSALIIERSFILCHALSIQSFPHPASGSRKPPPAVSWCPDAASFSVLREIFPSRSPSLWQEPPRVSGEFYGKLLDLLLPFSGGEPNRGLALTRGADNNVHETTAPFEIKAVRRVFCDFKAQPTFAKIRLYALCGLFRGQFCLELQINHK